MRYNITRCSRLRLGVTLAVRGITLIELMVVVSIIGILAILVFPSFEQQILVARRGEGIHQLLQLKIQQEAYRLEHVTYGSSEQLSMPISEFYTFSILDISPSTYTLQAKAIGSQESDTKCKSFKIDQSLNKSPKHCFSM